MQFYDQAAVRAVLAPYEVLIANVVMDAWRSWRSIPSDLLLALSKGRPRANVVASLMHAKLADLEDVVGVSLVEQYETTSLLIENKILVRFKKLDEAGLSRNYPTQRALEFNMQLPLPGIPPVIRVDAGYVLDAAGIRIVDILIALRIAGRVQWKYTITDTSSVVQIPQRAAEPKAPSKGRVTVKGEGSDHDEQKHEAD